VTAKSRQGISNASSPAAEQQAGASWDRPAERMPPRRARRATSSCGTRTWRTACLSPARATGRRAARCWRA